MFKRKKSDRFKVESTGDLVLAWQIRDTKTNKVVSFSNAETHIFYNVCVEGAETLNKLDAKGKI